MINNPKICTLMQEVLLFSYMIAFVLLTLGMMMFTIFFISDRKKQKQPGTVTSERKKQKQAGTVTNL